MSFMSPKTPKVKPDPTAEEDRKRAQLQRDEQSAEERERELARMSGKRGTQALATAGFAGFPTMGSGTRMLPTPGAGL